MLPRKLNPVDYSPCPMFNCQPQRKNFSRKCIFHTPRRIKMLAQPKCVTPKREPEKKIPFKKDIQIITDENLSTRLQQLAIPKVRKLVAARDEYAKFKNKCFIERFNKMINKSLFTVYSRLANVEVPMKRRKSDKWTEAEWRSHQEWLGGRAKHKWPFDFKLPDPFYGPITKIPSRTRPVTPYFKEYEKQLKQMTEKGLENRRPDYYERPRLNAEEWKKKRELLKTRPITPYIEEYGEQLRAQAAEMKVLREERKGELHPGPREQWNYDARQKLLEQVYKSRPKWTEKLAEPPCWIKEQADKEVAEVKYLQEQKKTVGNRYKLRNFSGGPRTKKLALATEEQKEQLKELLEVQKKEREAILQGFKMKYPKMRRLLENHPLYKSVQKLSEPLARFKREKVTFPENYNRFINYW